MIFGFCWKIPDKLFEDVGTIFFDTFEECDNLNALESIDNLTQLMYLSILYPNDDKQGFRNRLKEFIKTKFINNEKLNVYICLKIIIEYCIINDLYINHYLITMFYYIYTRTKNV